MKKLIIEINRVADHLKAIGTPTRVCKMCGRPISGRRHKKTCSDRCRQRLSRSNRK